MKINIANRALKFSEYSLDDEEAQKEITEILKYLDAYFILIGKTIAERTELLQVYVDRKDILLSVKCNWKDRNPFYWIIREPELHYEALTKVNYGEVCRSYTVSELS